MTKDLANDFQELLKQATPIISNKNWDIVTWKVLSTSNKMILVDLNSQFTWIITGTDLNSSIQDVSEIKEWDFIEAMVMWEDKDSWLVLLSLKKASQIKLIERLHSNFDTKEIITVIPNEANKWWLLIDLDGIKWFIPVSQLTPINYPRVEWAEAWKILEHLQKLVWKPFKVRVINVDQDGKKIIFSEKAWVEDQRKVALDKLKIWDKAEWVVSWILTYGLFITFNWLEWLVHVSEIDWWHVSDPSKFAKIWDKVSVQVIGIETDKISLSMKRLRPNPWEELAKKFKVWDIVNSPIIRISKFWVFLALDWGINWLIHLSEISNSMVKNIEDFVKVWDMVKAKIIALDVNEKRIGLSMRALETPKPWDKEPKEPSSVQEKKITKKKPVKEDTILDIKEEEYKQDASTEIVKEKKTSMKNKEEVKEEKTVAKEKIKTKVEKVDTKTEKQKKTIKKLKKLL